MIATTAWPAINDPIVLNKNYIVHVLRFIVYTCSVVNNCSYLSLGVSMEFGCLCPALDCLPMSCSNFVTRLSTLTAPRLPLSTVKEYNKNKKAPIRTVYSTNVDRFFMVTVSLSCTLFTQ